MSSVWTLTKTQLLSLFDLNIARYTKDKKLRRRNIALFVLMAFSFGSIGMFLYMQSYFMMPMLMGMTLPTALPMLYYTVYFALGFLSTTIRGTSLYTGKDWDQNLSFPVTRTEILLSKLLMFYLMELATSFMFLFPIFLVYAQFQPVGRLYALQAVLAILLAPILPLALGALVSVVVNWIFLRLPFKNFISAFVGIAFVAGIMYFSFQSTSGNMEVVVTETGVALSQSIHQFFPLSVVFAEGFFLGNGGQILLFFLLSVISFFIFLFLLSKVHATIAEHLQTKHRKKEYSLSSRVFSPTIALISKEFRYYFSNSNYIVNTVSGGVVAVIFAVVAKVQPSSYRMIEGFLGKNSMPYIVCMGVVFMTNISGITPSSLSLEGHSFQLLKSTPVSPISIFLAKILHQTLVFLPFTVLAFIIFAVTFQYSLSTAALAIVFLIIITIFFAAFGLIINLWFPKFDWDNETEVFKQGMPVLLYMLGSFIGAIVFFGGYLLLPITNPSLRFLICTVLAAFFLAVAISYLYRFGSQRYYGLEV